MMPKRAIPFVLAAVAALAIGCSGGDDKAGAKVQEGDFKAEPGMARPGAATGGTTA